MKIIEVTPINKKRVKYFLVINNKRVQLYKYSAIQLKKSNQLNLISTETEQKKLYNITIFNYK